jgi:tetratricopeptide (TPR) repeat protein
LGLVAMLWVYGVAWHQPMADSFGWARAAVASRVSSLPALPAGVRDRSSGLARLGNGPGMADKASAGATAGGSSAVSAASANGLPIDPEVAALVVDRKRRLATLSVEGPRMLETGNWRQAMELCGTWASLDLDNAQAWSCYGRALQAEGYHFQAVKALRKARQYDPTDGTLDAAINRSQRGIISDFLSRRGL